MPHPCGQPIWPTPARLTCKEMDGCNCRAMMASEREVKAAIDGQHYLCCSPSALPLVHVRISGAKCICSAYTRSTSLCANVLVPLPLLSQSVHRQLHATHTHTHTHCHATGTSTLYSGSTPSHASILSRIASYRSGTADGQSPHPETFPQSRMQRVNMTTGCRTRVHEYARSLALRASVRQALQ